MTETNLIFLILKLLNSNNSYMFSLSRNVQVTFLEKPQFIIISFQNYKH